MKKKNYTVLAAIVVVCFLVTGMLVGCSPECQHAYVDKVVEPTCTEGGYTEHTCSKCGESHTDTPTEALGHNYTEEVVAPTCTEEGYTLYTCTRCKDSYRDNEVPTVSHTYGQTLEFDAEGHYHVCEVCGQKDQVVPHTFEGAYGFSAEGHWQTCECGATSAVEAHVFDVEVMNEDTLKSEATCTEPATYFKSCKCGWMSSDETFTDGEPLGHTMTHHPAVPGTETTYSYLEYWECSTCNKLYKDEAGTQETTMDEIKSTSIGRVLTLADSTTNSDSLFVQSGDKITYTRGDTDQFVQLLFGSQTGFNFASIQFDLTVNSGDWGDFAILFRMYDGNSRYSLHSGNAAEDEGQILVTRTEWSNTAGGAVAVHKTNVNGFKFANNEKYRIEIMCIGWDKVIRINDQIVYKVSESIGCEGYFGFEGWALQSVTIENAVLRYYVEGNDEEKIAAMESDFPYMWDELSESVTNTCAHNYIETVVPATCTEDGYTLHKCEYCGDEYTDNVVESAGEHTYVEYRHNETQHWGICSGCGQTGVPEDHVYDREVAEEKYLKSAETYEHGAIYYKSCVCGVGSKSDTDTFEAPQQYKYIDDAVNSGDELTQNLTQQADGSLTYTRGDADQEVSISFGAQSGNPNQYISFTLRFVASDWGKFSLYFARWDGANNIELLRDCKIYNKNLVVNKNKWDDASSAAVIKSSWEIEGFQFEDNTDYHVEILKSGWQKVIKVNGTVIFRCEDSELIDGYFRFQSWALQSLTISDIIVEENFADNAAFEQAHPDLWDPVGEGITVTKKETV